MPAAGTLVCGAALLRRRSALLGSDRADGLHDRVPGRATARSSIAATAPSATARKPAAAMKTGPERRHESAAEETGVASLSSVGRNRRHRGRRAPIAAKARR